MALAPTTQPAYCQPSASTAQMSSGGSSVVRLTAMGDPLPRNDAGGGRRLLRLGRGRGGRGRGGCRRRRRGGRRLLVARHRRRRGRRRRGGRLLVLALVLVLADDGSALVGEHAPPGEVGRVGELAAEAVVP